MSTKQASPVREITVLQYAIEKGQSLTWVYAQCRLGKLPTRKVYGRWLIQVGEGEIEESPRK